MLLKNDNITVSSLPSGEYKINYSSQPYDDLKNLTELHLYDEPMPSELFFTISYNNEIAGEMSLKSIRWYNHKAEISIFLNKEYRKKGLAYSALQLLLSHTFKTLNFHRLEAEVVAYNKQGIKLFEKLGFKQEGQLRESKFYDGKYHDTISYGMLAREFRGGSG